MANKLFSFFKQGSNTYEVKDAQARADIVSLNNDLLDLKVPTAPYTDVSLLNVSSYTPTKSGFYLMIISPSSNTAVYARLKNSSTNHEVFSTISTGGVEECLLVYLEANVTYTVEKSASGIRNLLLRQ